MAVARLCCRRTGGKREGVRGAALLARPPTHPPAPPTHPRPPAPRAVDLLDEAAAHIRVQIDSQPEAIDKLERKLLQLEVEATMLRLEAEADFAAKARLGHVLEQIANCKEELAPLQLRHAAEHERVERLRAVQRSLEAKRVKLAQAERDRDLTLVADLRYGAIPELEARLAQLAREEAESTAAGGSAPRMVSEVVGPEEIADVVSRWTGIPVSALALRELWVAVGCARLRSVGCARLLAPSAGWRAGCTARRASTCPAHTLGRHFLPASPSPPRLSGAGVQAHLHRPRAAPQPVEAPARARGGAERGC